MRRLHVRIYLTTLLSLLAVVLVTALLWGLIMQRAMESQHESLAAAVAGHALPPPGAAHDAVTAGLHGYLSQQVAGLELRDRDGALIGSAGTLAGGSAAGVPAHGVLSLHRIQLRDGRMLLIELGPGRMGGFHLHGLAIFVWIALGVAVATYPLARRLTRRLEALAGAVDRFGGGDLAVRAATDGRDEVSVLAQSFNRMADRVGSLLQAHRRLLANASHELRSPLARIRMALELHGNSADAPWLEGMRRDCAEIDAQIEEILLASKLETVQTRSAESLDLAVLVAEECVRMQVPFEVVPAPLRGDARLLRRLLRNLLDNAQKHGGKAVEARGQIAADGARLLQVSDRGPGIPAADRERIFEPFYRPAGAKEIGSGWGLGLALVKQIAEHHGGSVVCRERDGGGCVFEVRLPQG